MIDSCSQKSFCMAIKKTLMLIYMHITVSCHTAWVDHISFLFCFFVFCFYKRCHFCFIWSLFFYYYLADIELEPQPRSDGQQLPSSTRRETSGCNLFCSYGKQISPHIPIYTFYLFNYLLWQLTYSSEICSPPSWRST